MSQKIEAFMLKVGAPITAASGAAAFVRGVLEQIDIATVVGVAVPVLMWLVTSYYKRKANDREAEESELRREYYRVKAETERLRQERIRAGQWTDEDDSDLAALEPAGYNDD